MRTKITICVAVYNIREKFLRECLESVLCDKSEDVRILIGDDCSDEACAAICREYAARDGRVQYIRPEKNGGVSAIRNEMIKAADGEVLTFIDGDDAVPAEYVSNVRNAANAGYDIVMFEQRSFSGELPEVKNYVSDMAELPRAACKKFSVACLSGAPGEIDKFGIKNSTPSSVCNKVYRRDFLIRNNIFFTVGLKKSQDTEFNTRAFYHSTSLGYMPCELYLYRKNPESICNRYSADFAQMMFKCFECDIKNLRELYGNDEEIRQLLYKYKLILIFIDNCRLNLFHKDNPKSRGERRAEFLKFIGEEPYRSFFAEFDIEAYPWRERRLALSLAKKKSFAALDFLYRHTIWFRIYGAAANRLSRVMKRGSKK